MKSQCDLPQYVTNLSQLVEYPPPVDIATEDPRSLNAAADPGLLPNLDLARLCECTLYSSPFAFLWL